MTINTDIPDELKRAITLDPLGAFFKYPVWTSGTADAVDASIRQNTIDRMRASLDFTQPDAIWAIPVSDARCEYCGNTGSVTNVRGGVECAGCGHPR